MKLHDLLLASILLSTSAWAQDQSPKPDHANIPYDEDHEAQVLDVYLAKQSDSPAPVIVYIHGGGWRAGSKDRLPGFLGQVVREGWAAVVAVEYRFTDVAPHPAQANDCLRAIQFTRANAKKWNLDPSRLALTGGSAGAHLSLWVGLHDDAKDPGSDDPVARRSSRATCVIAFAGPTDFGLLAEIDHKHPAYRQLLGYEPGTPAAELDVEKVTHVSPITFASVDDPPVLLFHGTADTVVPFAHAERLDTLLDSLEVPCELFIVQAGKHNVAGGAGEGVPQRATAFAKKHLLAN